MLTGQELNMTTIDGDLILLAARATLGNQPNAATLDRELAERLHMGELTRDQLRADIRQMLAAYRAWRREARCGRATDDASAVHLPLTKQLRRAWATYRLVQLLLRDMVAIAGPMGALKGKMGNFNPIANAGDLYRSMPTITPAPVVRTPANNDTPPQSDIKINNSGDISYEELEMKYGPSLAQKLFDEIKRQNGGVASATVKISD